VSDIRRVGGRPDPRCGPRIRRLPGMPGRGPNTRRRATPRRPPKRKRWRLGGPRGCPPWSNGSANGSCAKARAAAPSKRCYSPSSPQA
jgi:hypothetical protein